MDTHFLLERSVSVTFLIAVTSKKQLKGRGDYFHLRGYNPSQQECEGTDHTVSVAREEKAVNPDAQLASSLLHSAGPSTG